MNLGDKVWNKLNYWKSGEYQVVQEKLKDEEKAGHVICPSKKLLFEALRQTPFGRVRACIIGQDPYPNRHHACGIAFSIPETETTYPASLRNMFTELVDDLGGTVPDSGSLLHWCHSGVLLWNVYPSCREGSPGSHHWDEWTYLTKEIVEKLDERHIVFCLLGGHAREYSKYINSSCIIATSHPSPLGARHGFLGSRIYSSINECLRQQKKEEIQWQRLSE